MCDSPLDHLKKHFMNIFYSIIDKGALGTHLLSFYEISILPFDKFDYL